MGRVRPTHAALRWLSKHWRGIVLGVLQIAAAYWAYAFTILAGTYAVLMLAKRTPLLPGDVSFAPDLPTAATFISLVVGMHPAAILAGLVVSVVAPRLGRWVAVLPIIFLLGSSSFFREVPSTKAVSMYDMMAASALLAAPGSALAALAGCEVRRGLLARRTEARAAAAATEAPACEANPPGPADQTNGY